MKSKLEHHSLVGKVKKTNTSDSIRETAYEVYEIVLVKPGRESYL